MIILQKNNIAKLLKECAGKCLGDAYLRVGEALPTETRLSQISVPPARGALFLLLRLKKQHLQIVQEIEAARRWLDFGEVPFNQSLAFGFVEPALNRT